MSALCLSTALREIVVAVTTLTLVVNALAMMVRVATPGEAFRNTGVAICLLLASTGFLQCSNISGRA